MTKESGENVGLICEFRGHPQPVIKWYKNEAPVDPIKGKIEIRRHELPPERVNSKLRIQHLDTHDTGYYKCEATNGQDTIESLGILKVQGGTYKL